MDSSPASPGSSPLGLLFFYILLLCGAAYFAAVEASFSSVNRIRMMSLADDGNKRARRVLYILDHFDKAITTILIGTNIMQIGCASLATLIAVRMSLPVAVATVVTTVLVFFAAEMIPKTFAVASSERVTMFFSRSLQLLMKVLTPISYPYEKLAAFAKKPFKKKLQTEELTVTEDELHDIIETVAKEGTLDEDRTELMQSALDFQKTTVSEAFTPWDRVVFVKTSMPSAEIKEIISSGNHSRLPVLNDRGDVVGVLQIRKYLKAYIERDGHLPLYRVMDPPEFVSAELPIDELLQTLSAHKTHIAIVRDEKHEPVGIITVEDILEELVGEIYDEDDEGGEQL
ncbi:MAG: hemolysin family protein [Clostridia bacterium]|nr:hemolysin family protein [Clostridia bacterium]